MSSSKSARRTTSFVASIETDEQSANRLADALSERFEAGEIAITLFETGGGLWRTAIYFPHAPDEDAVRALAAASIGTAAKALCFGRVAEKDWVEASLAGLKPVVAGRFVVHGAHDRHCIQINRIGIEIEAALAFGTGHHGTTRGCLLAFDRFCKAASHKRPLSKRRCRRTRAKRTMKRLDRTPHILDLGTGTGVLAIAAARALHRRVLATDIDLSAVHIARVNARLNRAGPMIEIVQANGVAGRNVRVRAPFDLIFANILLRPLQHFAAPLVQLAAPGACVILSGLLPAQANAAIVAYRALALERRMNIDGWTTLILKCGRRPHPAVARRRPRP